VQIIPPSAVDISPLIEAHWETLLLHNPVNACLLVRACPTFLIDDERFTALVVSFVRLCVLRWLVDVAFSEAILLSYLTHGIGTVMDPNRTEDGAVTVGFGFMISLASAHCLTALDAVEQAIGKLLPELVHSACSFDFVNLCSALARANPALRANLLARLTQYEPGSRVFGDLALRLHLQNAPTAEDRAALVCHILTHLIPNVDSPDWSFKHREFSSLAAELLSTDGFAPHAEWAAIFLRIVWRQPFSLQENATVIKICSRKAPPEVLFTAVKSLSRRRVCLREVRHGP
jgi:hypothetical protein